jgi:hypothetical protein
MSPTARTLAQFGGRRSREFRTSSQKGAQISFSLLSGGGARSAQVRSKVGQAW